MEANLDKINAIVYMKLP
jgi:hypothetical protein